MADPGGPSPVASDGGAFLAERSFTGQRWRERPVDARAAAALAQRLDLPEIVARVLAGRGVGIDGAEAFLSPTLRASLPDPSALKDMDAAAERLAAAVVQGERIAVFGDYDVDGATASALLARFLGAVGVPARVYIPDRQREGYGPNTGALRALAAEGASLVVTVDCGVGAHEPLADAAASGLDVIVVDHHAAGAPLPPAAAVVNPNRLDESGAHGQLAAVGVAFLLAVAVNRVLRRAGWFDRRPEPDLREWLDLVALGTVCDMVPLDGVNRALVAQGLKVMARRANPGLRALADVAGLDEPPGVYHAGFVFGPRINAGGRVGEAGLGARLLTTEDTGEATDLARRLDAFNRERQAIEAAVLAEAEAALAAAGDDGPVVLAAGEGWHPGVVGIVAGRLAERYRRPACVVALDGEVGTGSGRSVAGANLGAAVIAAAQAGLLVKGGGHPMAAGFTVETGRMAAFRAFLAERLGSAVAEAAATRSLALDGRLAVGGASVALAEALARVGPFGIGNPEPRFAIASGRLAYAETVGRDGDHVKCTVEDAGGMRLDAIAFRAASQPLGQALLSRVGVAVTLAGRVRSRTWRGRTSAQLLIDDAAAPAD